MRKTFLHFLAENGYYLNNFCGRGICQKCTIIFAGKKILACQTPIPKEKKKRLLKKIILNPQFLLFSAPKIPPVFYSAIDLGTTNIRISYLQGKRFVKKIFTNPHFLFGSDIFSRINNYHLLKRYPLKKYLRLSELKKAIVVGNPIMYHFLLNKVSLGLGKYPYKSLIPPKEVIYPIKNNKNIQMVPIISTFIGGDITAGILATNLHKRKSFSLLVDLGTNGEIVLGNKDKIFAVSCAAGPAFEERFHYYGAKIVAYLAHLLKEKILDKSGRLKKKDQLFSQKDIRELQLAKAAIASGILILSQIAQIPLSQIERIYLTGNFGAQIAVDDLYTIGLLPSELKGQLFIFPDLPLKGAEKILKENLLTECLNITNKAESFFLPEIKEFTEIFIKQIAFP